MVSVGELASAEEFVPGEELISVSAEEFVPAGELVLRREVALRAILLLCLHHRPLSKFGKMRTRLGGLRGRAVGRVMMGHVCFVW